MARRMIGSSGASNSSSSRRSISPPVAKSRTALPRARRCLFVSVHNSCFPQPVRGAAWRRAMQDSEREGVAGGRRCRQILNVRHAVFLSWTGRGTRLGSQSATAFRLHAASREIPLVRCCMLASVLRAKRRWLCPATATRLELRRPELCPLRHATPTKICTAGVRLSSQDRRAGGVTFDGRCLGPLPCSTSDSGAPGSTVPASRAS